MGGKPMPKGILPMCWHEKNWEQKIPGLIMTHLEKRVNVSINSWQWSRIWVQLLPPQTKAQPPPMHWHGKQWEEKILGLAMTRGERRVKVSIHSCQRSRIWFQLLPWQNKALPPPMHWHGKNWEGKIIGFNYDPSRKEGKCIHLFISEKLNMVSTTTMAN